MPEVCTKCGEYKIDLGCGDTKKEGFIGVDISDKSNADIIHDLRKGLPFCSNSASYIYARNFIEHLTSDEFIDLMKEVWRVLKKDGDFYAETAYGMSDTRWQDPTHKMGFTTRTFDYFEYNNRNQQLYGLPPFYEIKKEHIGEIIKVRMKVKK